MRPGETWWWFTKSLQTQALRFEPTPAEPTDRLGDDNNQTFTYRLHRQSVAGFLKHTRARASRAVEPGVGDLLRDVRRTGGPPGAQSTGRGFGRGFGRGAAPVPGAETPSTWYCQHLVLPAPGGGGAPLPKLQAVAKSLGLLVIA